MTARRGRRPSRLADMNPVTGAMPSGPRKRTASNDLSERQGIMGGKSKVTFQLDPVLAGKLRGAFRVDGPQRGVLSLSAWVEEVLQARVDEYEAAHGEIDVLPPGQIPTGKGAL